MAARATFVCAMRLCRPRYRSSLLLALSCLLSDLRRVPQQRIGDLADILRSVPPEEVIAKREAVIRLRSRFYWVRSLQNIRKGLVRTHTLKCRGYPHKPGHAVLFCCGNHLRGRSLLVSAGHTWARRPAAQRSWDRVGKLGRETRHRERAP